MIKCGEKCKGKYRTNGVLRKHLLSINMVRSSAPSRGLLRQEARDETARVRMYTRPLSIDQRAEDGVESSLWGKIDHRKTRLNRFNRRSEIPL